MPIKDFNRIVALLAEGVDRNFNGFARPRESAWSPSSRRAWIEIMYYVGTYGKQESPSSRRAWIEITMNCCGTFRTRVALLAEGVDRNIDELVDDAEETVSPSSRRAWIEIHREDAERPGLFVALLAEGVDRNWTKRRKKGAGNWVALLAEGVDRNVAEHPTPPYLLGRPPRGGRG